MNFTFVKRYNKNNLFNFYDFYILVYFKLVTSLFRKLFIKKYYCIVAVVGKMR